MAWTWCCLSQKDQNVCFHCPAVGRTLGCVLFSRGLGLVYTWKNFKFRYCSTFVCLWQIISNHKLIRIKRFISRFTGKLYNLFLFSSIFNTLCMCHKIWCDEESWNLFFWFLDELNKALANWIISTSLLDLTFLPGGCNCRMLSSSTSHEPERPIYVHGLIPNPAHHPH
jgi:hypothetical protein